MRFAAIFLFALLEVLGVSSIRLLTVRRARTHLRCSAIEDSSSFVPNEVMPVKFSGPGCVLLAQPNDHSHFFVRAAIFIYQYNVKDGAKGVILERPTAFSMGESSPGIGVFEGNTLYMGGDDGSDTALMLGRIDFGGTCKNVGSGIFLGGMKSASELVKSGGAVPKDFKFFFNNAEWGPNVLEKELESGKWDVVKLPPEDILRQDTEMNVWSRARNTLISAKSKQL